MTGPARRYRLEFHGGSRDGEVLLLDELPDQDEFSEDGYWVEEVIINDRVPAVPLHRAIPNGWPLWWEAPDTERRLRRRRRPAWAQTVVFAHDRVGSHEAMLAAVRAAGCTCAVEIYVSDLDRRARIYHDSWCPLLRQGDVN